MNDQTHIKLLNTTGLEFRPVNEEYREYDYVVNGKVTTLRVEQPRYINIHPEHGAHRILDAAGVSHYMPGHWLTRVALRWKTNEGEPHFSFTVASTGNDHVDLCDGEECIVEEPIFAIPEQISDLFQRLGEGAPFATHELEEAASFFRMLEGEIVR